MVAKSKTLENIAIKICNLSKNFKHVNALKNINLDINKGEIIALVGGNGAGKSTLIKLLSGVYLQDEGYFYIDGKKIINLTPELSIELGITTVYQDLSLVDTLNIPSNIFLGNEPIKNKVFLDKKRMFLESEKLIKKLNLNIPSLDVDVSMLSGGQRQGIAMARAINQGGRVLILDEPTAAMGVKESSEVFNLIKTLSNEGYTIILICHNIQQVFNVSHHIVAMYHGEIIANLKTSDTNEKEVINYINGFST